MDSQLNTQFRYTTEGAFSETTIDWEECFADNSISSTSTIDQATSIDFALLSGVTFSES